MNDRELKALAIILQEGQYGSFPSAERFVYCNAKRSIKVPAKVFTFLRRNRLVGSQRIGQDTFPYLTTR